MKDNGRTRTIGRDIRFFVFGLFVIYFIGCAILALTLGFFTDWGLIERGKNGIYFSIDESGTELVEFYNVFNTPKLVYLQLLREYPFLTILLSLASFLALMRLPSSREKNKISGVINETKNNEKPFQNPFGIDFIILDLPGLTREEVFSAIAKFIEEKGLTKESKGIKERFMEKERLGSTGIGGGIALPEACFIDMVKEYVLILCRLKEKIDFDSIDSEPVSILLVFLCRGKNEISRLKPIMRLIEFLGSEVYKKRFLDAMNEQDCYRILEEAAYPQA